MHDLANFIVFIMKFVELIVSDQFTTLLQRKDQLLIRVAESDIGNFNFFNFVEATKHARTGGSRFFFNSGCFFAIIGQELLNFFLEVML